MCMADMYSRAGEEYAVAHCHFHLRGADSDADAELVERWAKAHGVRFFRADFDTAAYASEHGISIEMAARELRYTWFARIASQHGFDAVAVAHNANDNAETLLLNLLRGTGLRGIRGMASDSPLPGVRLIRPMLGMTREEIEQYAREHDVEYREDRTNSESDYKRNRIRNKVFPEFARINPSFVRTLNADMERFAQADAIAEDYFREAEGRVVAADGSIIVGELLALKHWRYVFFRLMEPCGFSAPTFESAVRLLQDFSEGQEGTFAGKRFLSPTHILETSAGSMAIIERTADSGAPGPVNVPGPGDYPFNGRTVRIEYSDGKALKQPDGVLVCNPDALRFPLKLRTWKPGDWMRPFGMRGKAKKLSDLFTDRKMSLSDKAGAIIVEAPGFEEGHVAAVAGLRMDEALRVAKGSGKVIRITLL